jgi:hypothetical protein
MPLSNNDALPASRLDRDIGEIQAIPGSGKFKEKVSILTYKHNACRGGG